MAHRRQMTHQPEPPAGLTDDTLLLRMRSDDTDAFRLLVERHLDRAYALAFRLLRNSADAEDVAQDAMVRTWTLRRDWQPGKARFSTWLYRVVVNRAIDLKRRPGGESLDDIPEPPDHGPDHLAGLQRQEIVHRLEAAIGQLPPQQRIALTLAYFDDLGNGDIAEIMGTTVSAVESLLKRGRQGLRERLHRAEHEVRQFLADS